MLQQASADQEPGYIEPSRVRFLKRGAALHLTLLDEVSWLDVSVTRLFPLSSPEDFLYVCNRDDCELGIIKSLAGLDVESRDTVRSDLQRRYFLPIIRRIVAVRRKSGVLEWEVETDRGRHTFKTRNLRENVVQPSPVRFLLNDVDGNRYEVRDASALDPASRGYISRYL